ncbi:MAG: DUF3616 domain-containing protein [Alphaproteobacteria bacterium]|nr:DUF3616 domain-containing protein [Alphaproteobacteria bacterium]
MSRVIAPERAAPRFHPVRTGVALTLALALASAGIAIADVPPQSGERHRFEAVYEPSGVAQLPNGQVVVVDDDKKNPTSFFSLTAEMVLSEEKAPRRPLLSLPAKGFPARSLVDLEAVDVDQNGYIYAITSNSRSDNGTRSVNREKLIRFRFEDNRIVEPQVLTGLLSAMTEIDDQLTAAIVRGVKKDNRFNIEGLSFSANGEQLLIGLRTPVISDRAVILVLNNPGAAMDGAEEPQFAREPIYLDLDGGGIRALAYDNELEGMLILSRQQKKGKKFKLWLWDPASAPCPRPVRIKGDPDLANAEGITPVRHAGQARILMVFDNGKRSKAKGGEYMFLDYDQLEIKTRACHPDPALSSRDRIAPAYGSGP